MIISFLASLLGALVTGSQALLIYLQGEIICFNEGCAIVDGLTRFDPIYFNIFGFCFFLLTSFGLNRARKGSDLWKRFVSLLLLAALAGEAVLFSFQLFVTDVFCSYCLIILALVVVANLFMGLKQIFKGVIIFTAVLIASASLNYSAPAEEERFSLSQGSISRLEVVDSHSELYFFFSAECRYCEQVLEFMQDGVTCTVNFNPIEPVDSFSFAGAVNTESYNPDGNRGYLSNLGIRGIPVLLSQRAGTITVIRGASGIIEFLTGNCSLESAESSMTSIPEQGLSLPISSTEDSCLPELECEEPQGTSYKIE
jgi:hypothetical protein